MSARSGAPSTVALYTVLAMIAGVSAAAVSVLWHGRVVAPNQTRQLALWFMIAAVFLFVAFVFGVRYGRSSAEFDLRTTEERNKEESHIAEYHRWLSGTEVEE